MMSSASALPVADTMPLRDKIAQLIFVRIGSNMPPVRTVEQDEERVARLLEECPAGGLLLFNGGPGTKKSLERLQAASKVPLLVGSDIERGVGQQVKGYTLFPHAMAFDRLGPHAAEAVGMFAKFLSQEARDVGIHITFAPVADVNTNPRNPIIATRAFSESPERAAELTRAFVAVAESTGLSTTAKHFPGHGDTETDSHDSLPSLPLSRSELEARELVPFQAAFDAGCSLVMTAHISYPMIDPSGVPATLSPMILQQLLRRQMGFRGVVCSDSLLMAGVRDRFEREEEMALAVLNAGVDLLLDLSEPTKVVDYLCKRAATGHLDVKRVDEAFDRLWALKQRMSVTPPSPRPVKEERSARSAQVRAHSIWLDSAVGKRRDPSAGVVADFVAKYAVEILDSSRNCLPFNCDAPLVAILLKPFETPIESPEQPLAAALRERFRGVEYLQLGPQAGATAYQSAFDLSRNAKQLLVAMIVRPAAWHAYGLRPKQIEFVRRIVRERSDVVLVSLGAPYALADYPEAALRICTFSDVPVSQQALAEFLVRAT